MLVQRLTSFLSFLPVSSDDVDDTGDAGATRFTVLSDRKKKTLFRNPTSDTRNVTCDEFSGTAGPHVDEGSLDSDLSSSRD